MNILVKTFGGHIVARPDTTWEKNSSDFFPPDFVESLSFTPVCFCHISKAGKSVGGRFASRYYDGVGVGLMLYPDNLMDGSLEGFAQACCLDHTSFLHLQTLPPQVLDEEGCDFKINLDGKELRSFSDLSRNTLEEAIVQATKTTFIRRGDIVAVELEERSFLAGRPETAPVPAKTDSPAEVSPRKTSPRISVTLGERILQDFRIVF